MSKNATLLLALAASGLAACAGPPKIEPEIASSANHGGYAIAYPNALEAAMKGYQARQVEARKEMADFAGYPDRLKDPIWSRVLEILKRADEDGRGAMYAERSRRVDDVAAFYDAEKDDLNRKMTSSIAYAIKEKGSILDISGSVPPAFKNAIERQLEKEMDAVSEAHLLIERYRGSLGKENATALEKQVDDLSRASYLVHVELVEGKLRILRMIGEAQQVRRTADEFVAAERAFQSSEKKLSDADKKASDKRIADMEKSRSAIEASVQKAMALVPTFEDEQRKIMKEYDDALGALLAKIQAKTT